MNEVVERQAYQPRVILVDDDDLFRESLEQNLLDAGFRVTQFGDAPSALTYLIDGREAELILLDWKMPGMNGIEALRHIRDADIQVPVIFLTVLSDQIYEEAALMGGAVDFVEKSRSVSILLKRIELILSGTKSQFNSEPEAGSLLKEGHLELYLDTSRAFWRERQVDLSLTEFTMVQYMASRPGRDIRYRELYDLVHGAGFISGEGDQGFRANVRTFIKRIRQKFRKVDGTFEKIENYPGFGYRWRIDE